jgi:dihydrofolate reductase
MKIIAIAAVGQNGALGLNGKLPWDLPEDLRFFRVENFENLGLIGFCILGHFFAC